MRTLIFTLLIALGLLFGIQLSLAVTNIFVEAESGAFTDPMTNYLASQASGGRYVWIPPTNLFPGDGEAEYDVEITNSATYRIWCRVRAPNPNQDSFLVSVDNYPKQIFDVVVPGPWSRDWRWTILNGRTNGTNGLRLFLLTSGLHTIRFAGRNDGSPPESRTGLDRFIMTDDEVFNPNTNFVLLPEREYIQREAEDIDPGQITEPMRVALDPPASGGGYVWLPLQTNSQVKPVGLAYYDVNIPTGTNYVIWCRVRAPSPEEDSFFVSITNRSSGAAVWTNEVYDVTNTNLMQLRTSDYWQWTKVNGRASAAFPRTFPVPSGPVGMYRIVFSGREAYTALDRFVITDDPTFQPETPPKIISLARTNGTNTVSWSANIGTTYSLENTSTLNDPTWSDVGIITADTNTTRKTDVSMDAERFYRVRVLP